MTRTVTNANIISFIVGNPIFTAALAAGGDGPILTVANTVDEDSVANSPVLPSTFFDAIDAGEYATFTDPQLNSVMTMMSQGNINIGQGPAQAKIATVFASFPKTLAGLALLYTRPATPAEAYFAPGVTLTQQQIDDARNSVSPAPF